jgi:RNA polymerase primary sigma factor
MKVKSRKSSARRAGDRLGAATSARAVVRKKTGPTNRIERYFRAWPASIAVPAAGPVHRADQLLLRRTRARHIADLSLEYMPSREFHKPNAEQRIAGPMPASNAVARKVRTPAGLPPYLASLYETPLLTREQERHLFRKYNYLKYRAASLREKLNPKRPQVRLMDQIERLYKEAMATKNQIIQANLRLVVSIMKRYTTENDGIFELISEGNISLMRAVEKFDYTRGFRFSTYATWAIQRNNARDFANEIKRRIRFQTSQDAALADYPQEHFDPLHAERVQQERAVRVANVLERLDKRDREIIERRFGLAGNQESKTLQEVGIEMGVSKERVRQLEQRAMERLRVLAQDANLRDAIA